MHETRRSFRIRVSTVGSLAAILVLTGAGFAEAASSSSSSSRSSLASRSGSMSSLGRGSAAGRAAAMRHAKPVGERGRTARDTARGVRTTGSAARLTGQGTALPGRMANGMIGGAGGQFAGGGAAIRMRPIRPTLPSTMLYSPGSARQPTRPDADPTRLIQTPIPDPDTCTSGSSPACDESQRNSGAPVQSSLSAGSADAATPGIEDLPGLPPTNGETQNPLSSIFNPQSPLVSTSGGGGSQPSDARAAGTTLADCMKVWEPATHMTTSEWRAACIRTQDGNRFLSPRNGSRPSSLASNPNSESASKPRAKQIRQASSNTQRQR